MLGEPNLTDPGAQRMAGKQALQGLMDMLSED